MNRSLDPNAIKNSIETIIRSLSNDCLNKTTKQQIFIFLETVIQVFDLCGISLLFLKKQERTKQEDNQKRF
jgi:hypothetical protein